MNSNPTPHPRSMGQLLSVALCCACLGLSTAARAATTLIPVGATWKYLDNGSNQGTSWRDLGFNDSTWASGPAELGYGDGDEATLVSYGPDASNKYVTTYFRRAFSVTDATAITGLTLQLLYDDGAVVYLNGTEVFRVNMPSGTISSTTFASTALGTPAEATFVQAAISRSALVTGPNVLAVEIHQANGFSTDLSFNLQLTASTGVAVTRGPYLQMGTPSSLIVRWRTDVATDSRVRYGADPANLNLAVTDSAVTTEHQVTLTGLAADARYYYSVGSSAATQASGGDFVFYTPPPAGTAQPIRVWVLGDSGTANASAAAVRDSYYAFTGTRYTDLLLMLGDNAYNTGTDAEYQTAVFNMYPGMLRQTVLWPTIGNHDTAGSSTPSASLPYFNIFTLPTGGQAGGVPSGTEKYYSFDFGNIHFVCLDSMSSDRSASSPMWTWLASDLAANTKSWLIAFWHHPPYSKGSHDSDSETALVQMRQQALPLLEEHGVDLVLCGHSHSYERSFLLDGHYGSSTTITSSNYKSQGSGRDAAAYQKGSTGPAPHQGAVYAVAGSSGQISGGALNHPAMFVSLNELGSMVLDFDGNRLDAKFLSNTGVVRDYFTIVKGAAANQPPSVAVTAPAQNASFTAPANIAIAANASDEDGSINKVDFFANGTLIGTDTSAPYAITWSSVAVGSYSLTAAATDNLGAVTTSSSVAITVVAAPPPPPPPAPQAPSGLAGTAISSTQINLRWTDNSNNEGGFAMERAANGGAYTEIARLGPNVITYADSNLQPNVTYTYRVRAYNAGGFSGFTVSPGIQTLGAPGGLKATAVSNSQINLAWSDTSTGEQGFRIERADAKGTFALRATVAAGTTAFSDNNLAAGTSYSYRVQAFNASGTSSFSTTASTRTRPK